MTFHQFVTKALNDDAFRATLAKDPEKALKGAGMKPSPELVAALKKVNFQQIGKVAAAFGEKAAPDTIS